MSPALDGQWPSHDNLCMCVCVWGGGGKETGDACVCEGREEGPEWVSEGGLP
jgi:hypothetical protein